MGFQVEVMGGSEGKLATVITWAAISNSILPPQLQSGPDELVLLRRPEWVWGAAAGWQGAVRVQGYHVSCGSAQTCWLKILSVENGLLGTPCPQLELPVSKNVHLFLH